MHSLSCQSLPALFSRRAGTSAVRSYAGRAVKLELLLIEYQYNLSTVEMGPRFEKPALSLSAPNLKALHTDTHGKLTMTQAKPAQPQVEPHTTHAHTHHTKEQETNETQASTLPRPLRVSSWLVLARLILASELLAGFTLLHSS